MKTFMKSSSVGFALIAITAMLFAFFVVLPMLPQVDSSLDAIGLKAGIVAAFGGDGGGTGGGGGEGGGGCCRGGGNDNDNDNDNDPPPPAAPVCTLSANPNSINKGDSSTLTWTTSNATTVSINQGVGAVAKNGNTSVSPQTNTTYTLTATGAGGTVTCSAPITVIQPPAPVCTLDANPTSLPFGGGNSTLTWTTDNADSVSINNGVGTVALDGNTQVSVTNTITYTLTATGNGKTVTCAKTITVVPPSAPVCTLDIDKTSITSGESVALTWTSQNGVSATLNTASVAVNGNQSFAPTTNTTYTLVVTGQNNQTVTCEKSVTITTVPPLLCTLSANPTSLPHGGGTSTLTWTTDNATTVSIDNGVGPVALDGTQSVNVTNDTTYTLTAVRGNETKQCVVTIDVGDPQNNPLSCDAFTASPSNLPQGGGNTTLDWQTTGATSVSIDQGIGNVSVDGNQMVAVSASKTFTLTASNASSSVTCQVPVSVETGGGGGGGGSSRPRCDLFKASKTNIEPGEEITLSWKTRRGNELTIEPDIFATDDDDEVDEGSIKVKPKTDTRYTLTVERGTRKDTCTVDVNTGGPKVSVLSARDQQPITISLASLPYTGFNAGPTLTAIFYILLTFWSLAIAYVMVVKRGSVLGFQLPVRSRAQGTIIPHGEYKAQSAVHASVATPVVSTVPANLPVAPSATGVRMDDEEAEDDLADEDSNEDDESEDQFSSLENHAHMENVLLSSDALRMIAAQGETEIGQIALLDEVIARAKASYPREDGWLVINRERISELFK